MTWFGYRDESDAVEGGAPAFYAQIRQRDGTGGVTFEIGEAKGDRPDSSITQLSNGSFVVVWCDGAFGENPVSDTGADVKARIFDVGGQAVTDTFTVNTGIAADQFNPDVAALSDGRFVIVWQDGAEAPGVPAPASTIRAQVFGADGARFDEEFQVNVSSDINSGDPSVTSLGGDRFAVAWTGDEAGLGADGGIKVQLFAADGAPRVEMIEGAGGNDQLIGGFGHDQISGGKGADAIFAGFGADLVFGDRGEDTLYGGGGDDRVFGGWRAMRSTASSGTTPSTATSVSSRRAAGVQTTGCSAAMATTPYTVMQSRSPQEGGAGTTYCWAGAARTNCMAMAVREPAWHQRTVMISSMEATAMTSYGAVAATIASCSQACPARTSYGTSGRVPAMMM